MDNSKAIEIITKAIDFHAKTGATMLAQGARFGSELLITKGQFHELMAEALSEARYLYGYHSDEIDEFVQGDGSILIEMQECSYFDERAKTIIKFAKALG
ncbi:TPA: hypothetical protein SGN90_000877 [Proteus mirabilis]|nr:hypothetical protein [Proteus mirabilis]HBM9712616.1 hypothetical protein [Proteus mirabilis]HEH1584267.1 hypothetical protein [Proteus mirabilis]